jgi:hypothetical protein
MASTYSRSAPSPRYFELLAEYQQMHAHGEQARHIPPAQTYAGISLPRHAVSIKMLIDKFKARTLLDYGSGKGLQYGPMNVQLPDGTKYPSIPLYWRIEELYCYDPGHEPFNTLPSGKYDGVICTDVLEHCPEDDIPWIVGELFSHARHFLFANVACYPAMAHLNNGENAHCTIRDQAWWKNVIAGVAQAHSQVRYIFLLDQQVQRPGGRTELTSTTLSG